MPPPDAPTDKKSAVKKTDAIRVRVISNQPVGEPGGPYHKGHVFDIHPTRAAAIGLKVEDEEDDGSRKYLQQVDDDTPLGPPPEKAEKKN